ncbi:MAG: hypothetical protein ACI9MC_001943 [Kiritimatiellia bacterium]|jgi:hypothetical protein
MANKSPKKEAKTKKLTTKEKQDKKKAKQAAKNAPALTNVAVNYLRA